MTDERREERSTLVRQPAHEKVFFLWKEEGAGILPCSRCSRGSRYPGTGRSQQPWFLFSGLRLTKNTSCTFSGGCVFLKSVLRRHSVAHTVALDANETDLALDFSSRSFRSAHQSACHRRAKVPSWSGTSRSPPLAATWSNLVACSWRTPATRATGCLLSPFSLSFSLAALLGDCTTATRARPAPLSLLRKGKTQSAALFAAKVGFGWGPGMNKTPCRRRTRNSENNIQMKCYGKVEQRVGNGMSRHQVKTGYLLSYTAAAAAAVVCLVRHLGVESAVWTASASDEDLAQQHLFCTRTPVLRSMVS